MEPEILLFNHTIQRFLNGENLLSDTYKINLYSTFVFDATATTKTLAEVGATQLPTLNGYTQNNATLSSKVVNIFNTTNALFSAANQSWIPSGASLSAAWALCYNDTDANDPPVFAVDFKGTKTAANGVPFVIMWPAAGIIVGRKPVA